MQLIQHQWLNRRFIGKFTFRNKYKFNNVFLIPRIHQIVVSSPISSNINKHIDIAFWFLSILFEKHDFIFLTKFTKRTIFGKRLNLVGLKLHLTGKNLFWKLKKIVYQLLPPQEYRYKFLIRHIKSRIYNFSLRNLTTYSETEKVYNNPKQLLITDLSLDFNIHFSNKKVMHIYTFFKQFKNFPIRLTKRTRRKLRTLRYRKKYSELLWNLEETKTRELRYFRYKQRRLKWKRKRRREVINA